MELNTPRPASLPPPLSVDLPAVSRGAPCALESAEAATRRAALASGAPSALESAEAPPDRQAHDRADQEAAVEPAEAPVGQVVSPDLDEIRQVFAESGMGLDELRQLLASESAGQPMAT